MLPRFKNHEKFSEATFRKQAYAATHGHGGGPKAKKELLSSARKRRAAELARQAEEAEEAEQPGGEGGPSGEAGEAGEAAAAFIEGGEQLVFGKQLPSVAGPRRMKSPGGSGGKRRFKLSCSMDEQQSVYAATLSVLSFLPPEMAEGVARVRARKAGGGAADGV